MCTICSNWSQANSFKPCSKSIRESKLTRPWKLRSTWVFGVVGWIFGVVGTYVQGYEFGFLRVRIRIPEDMGTDFRDYGCTFPRTNFRGYVYGFSTVAGTIPDFRGLGVQNSWVTGSDSRGFVSRFLGLQKRISAVSVARFRGTSRFRENVEHTHV